MGWRYRKSITLFPGVRVNLGMKSASLSLGGHGIRTTYSTTGRVTRSFGIPGTGLSYVTSSKSNKKRSTPEYRRSTEALQQSQFSASSQIDFSTNPDIERSSKHDNMYYEEKIQSIFSSADMMIDWHQILIEDYMDIPNWEYFKSRAENVLNGDLNTYFEIINDINPVDDLLEYGSEFECGSDDPRMLSIHFKVNSAAVLKETDQLTIQEYNNLLQDYVCGCSIRVARDMFALLPIRRIIIDAENNDEDILSVEFTRREFLQTDFNQIDASDFVQKFTFQMDYNENVGFSKITPIDSFFN